MYRNISNLSNARNVSNEARGILRAKRLVRISREEVCVMASIYREHRNAKRWSARVRIQGRYLYRSGFKTKQAAKNWASEQELTLKGHTQPFGLGPAQTTLAAALREYAYQFSILNKGCPKEVTRINAWLQPAGLTLLKAKRLSAESGEAALENRAIECSESQAPKLFRVKERAPNERSLPKAFGKLRAKRLSRRRRSLEVRARAWLWLPCRKLPRITCTSLWSRWY